MKKAIAIASALLLMGNLSYAQDIPNHSLAVGKGPGSVAFGSAGPCIASKIVGFPLGVGSDPDCMDVPVVTTSRSQTFTGVSGNSTITLTTIPLPNDTQFLRIFFDGIKQHPSTWSYNAGTGVVTFTSNIPANTNEVLAEWFSPSTLSVGAAFSPGGRLTLQANYAVQKDDQTAATTIYYTCYNSPYVPLPNGTTGFDTFKINGCQIAMDFSTSVVAAGSAYDIFIINVSNTPTLCMEPTAWTKGDITGQGALTISHFTPAAFSILIHKTLGFWTNVNTMTNCFGSVSGATNYGPIAADRALYVGSVLGTGTGQVSMTVKPRGVYGGNNNTCGVYNAYNRVPFACWSQDFGAVVGGVGAPGWLNGVINPLYGVNPCDQSGPAAGLNNRINFLDPLGEDYWEATYKVSVSPATSAGMASTVYLGVGGAGSLTPNGLAVAGNGSGWGPATGQAGTPTFSPTGFSMEQSTTFTSSWNIGAYVGVLFVQCLEGANNAFFYGQDFNRMWLNIRM